MAGNSGRNLKKGKLHTPFILFLLVPLCLFILTAFLGSFLKLNRVQSETAFENRLNPLEKIWRGIQLKSYARQYGYDYRNKISENQRRVLGIVRESFLETQLPKYLFLALVIIVPCYFFTKLIKEKATRTRDKIVKISTKPIRNSNPKIGRK
ncbi:hypothetical protein LEP1GSC050_2362 [Leptospira broomii serovar Hurstbridge str. 5399]|uniref:Uncharacterized protein n=1 Tax=Leptospira broomii serovar Hurstbridge str. 5399 TaxID=1049789 RepID=T0F8T9_9LEPT|nr:hypothetical protein [Leptospira broomii]EQA44331.1 hypothetical protein LEP1GSC050_2362 [Leptospira broomii serovar Hurstbridge str. 5399]